MSRLLVVGAGPSGLGCATELARSGGHDVLLIDRVPVAGGESGWDEPEVRELVRAATDAGVEFRFGAAAAVWTDRRLLLTAPGTIRWVEADHLFYAGGLRPATASDLNIVGERPAGVLPATVADHLLSTGVRLWKRAVIVGDGPWAPHIAERIRGAGGHVTAVGAGSPTWADQVVAGGTGLEVLGRDRVHTLRVVEGTRARDLACDAVILAAGPLPNRNVDGALAEGAPHVTFVQPLDARGIAPRAQAGRAIAAHWARTNGGNP
ncbi:FAD-dependent oxidoreductase [Microbispora sp. H10949]|uniref:FAD-dependent oxidoreductase n=1 Tax=Microbispora sp. H10949 TaxID=2729111 RepID=UPI0016005447|nr:FAD-dependent oxidoreductase [Microbispora sp. H10949]